MQLAKNKALDYIKDNTADDVKDFIKDQGMDFISWAKNQIEVAIKNSKNNK